MYSSGRPNRALKASVKHEHATPCRTTTSTSTCWKRFRALKSPFAPRTFAHPATHLAARRPLFGSVLDTENVKYHGARPNAALSVFRDSHVRVNYQPRCPFPYSPQRLPNDVYAAHSVGQHEIYFISRTSIKTLDRARQVSDTVRKTTLHCFVGTLGF